MSLIKKKKPEPTSEGVDNFNEKMKKRTQSGGYVKGKRLIEQQKAFDANVAAMKQQLDAMDNQLKDLSGRIDKLIDTDKAVHDKVETPATEPEPKPTENE